MQGLNCQLVDKEEEPLELEDTSYYLGTLQDLIQIEQVRKVKQEASWDISHASQTQIDIELDPGDISEDG